MGHPGIGFRRHAWFFAGSGGRLAALCAYSPCHAL